MDSLDATFKQTITAITDTLNVLKDTLETVNQRTLHYEQVENNMKRLRETSEKATASLAKKEQIDAVEKKIDIVQKEVAYTKTEQKQQVSALEDIQQKVAMLTQKEFDDIDTLEKEMTELKNLVVDIESDISHVKNRLAKVGTTLQQHIGLKRSMR